MSTMYIKPELPIADPQRFGLVREAIASAFSARQVAQFFKSLSGANLRVRDFESVLQQGLLGAATAAQYGELSSADRGQIREFYLASLEQVSSELRERFYKLYAYY